MAEIILRKGEGRTIKAGGAWVFDNEIDRISNDAVDGEIVEVLDFDGYFMGYGFMNRNSKITVRLMSRHKEYPVDDALLEMRVRDAVHYRQEVFSDLPSEEMSCRLIFGEADWLPGLTVDLFGDVLVVESLALGIERLKGRILAILVEVLREEGIAVRGIYERSDARERDKEGLERVKGFLPVEPEALRKCAIPGGEGAVAFDTKIRIVENGVQYMVDVADGQKTGFFLDQKRNRKAIQRLSKGARVLDCFTHTGSFALNAGLAGAKEVLGVDASELGVRQAEENATLNGLQDRVKFMVADVFDLLPQLMEDGEIFDLVILDPPAFTKSRNSIKNAVKGYREINMRGLKLVKDGGYLATCSCSHFMDQDLFMRTIHEAARSAHKRLRQIEFRTQAEDHPILWANDTSYYLKFLIFQVVDEK